MTLRSRLCLADLQACCIISWFAIDGDADATGNGSLRRGVPRPPEFPLRGEKKGDKTDLNPLACSPFLLFVCCGWCQFFFFLLKNVVPHLPLRDNAHWELLSIVFHKWQTTAEERGGSATHYWVMTLLFWMKDADDAWWESYCFMDSRLPESFCIYDNAVTLHDRRL